MHQPDSTELSAARLQSLALHARAEAAITHATALCGQWRVLRADARRLRGHDAFGRRNSGRVMRAGIGAYSSAATRTSAEGDGDGRPEKGGVLWGSARVLDSRVVSVLHGGAALGDWVIREIDTSAFPSAPAPRCLVFENDSVVRRVWTYPAEWSGLPDAALLRLMGD